MRARVSATFLRSVAILLLFAFAANFAYGQDDDAETENKLFLEINFAAEAANRIILNNYIVANGNIGHGDGKIDSGADDTAELLTRLNSISENKYVTNLTNSEQVVLTNILAVNNVQVRNLIVKIIGGQNEIVDKSEILTVLKRIFQYESCNRAIATMSSCGMVNAGVNLNSFQPNPIFHLYQSLGGEEKLYSNCEVLKELSGSKHNVCNRQ